jgi:predicted Zn-dependent protease
MKWLPCIACLVGVCAACAGTQVLSADRLELGREVMRGIYSLDYAAAEQTCQRIIQADPEDPFGYALLARNVWAEQLQKGQGLTIDRFSGSEFYYGTPDQAITVSPEAERRFRNASDSAVARARARLARNPADLGAMFSLGLVLETHASYEFTIKASGWAAFKEAESALRMHRSVLTAAPDFADARLAQGVSYYAVASVPWSIRWLTSLLGYRGSKSRGKRELEFVASHGAILADDARTLLVLLHSRDGELDLAARQLEELGRRYPRNYLVPLELAAIGLRQHQPQKAISIYQSVLSNVQNRAAGYASLDSSHVYLRLGVAARASGDLGSSVTWLDRVLSNRETNGGSNAKLRAAAHLELGKTRDLRGERPLAIAQYRLVLEAEDFLGSRREAQSLLAHPYRSVR